MYANLQIMLLLFCPIPELTVSDTGWGRWRGQFPLSSALTLPFLPYTAWASAVGDPIILTGSLFPDLQLGLANQRIIWPSAGYVRVTGGRALDIYHPVSFPTGSPLIGCIPLLKFTTLVRQLCLKATFFIFWHLVVFPRSFSFASEQQGWPAVAGSWVFHRPCQPLYPVHPFRTTLSLNLLKFSHLHVPYASCWCTDWYRRV